MSKRFFFSSKIQEFLWNPKICKCAFLFVSKSTNTSSITVVVDNSYSSKNFAKVKRFFYILLHSKNKFGDLHNNCLDLLLTSGIIIQNQSICGLSFVLITTWTHLFLLTFEQKRFYLLKWKLFIHWSPNSNVINV